MRGGASKAKKGAAAKKPRNIPTPRAEKRPSPGRPRSFEDPQVRETLLEELRFHQNVGVAAYKAGIARDTVYAEMKRDPQFKREVEEARQLALDFVEVSVFSRARGGDLGACCWIQKNRDPEHWKDRRDIAHSNPDGSPLVPPRIVVEYVGDAE